jgi:hypothetical protein
MDYASKPASDAEAALYPKHRSAKLAFPLSQPWSERQWQSLLSQCQVSIYDVVRALGILAPGEECAVAFGVWTFGNATLDALSVAVSDVSKEVAGRFYDNGATGEDVVGAAANPHYLDEENGGVLERFGSEFWGLDRGIREGCRVRLTYEDDADRQV